MPTQKVSQVLGALMSTLHMPAHQTWVSLRSDVACICFLPDVLGIFALIFEVNYILCGLLHNVVKKEKRSRDQHCPNFFAFVKCV